MNLAERIDLMKKLADYLKANDQEWQLVKQRAFENNSWFTPEFIDLSLKNITKEFLDKEKLFEWTNHYHLDDNITPCNVGIVMAGNIPLVGFQDMLCLFICGHKQSVRLSSKDDVLLKHLTEKLYEWNDAVRDIIVFAEMLKGCDAYIATGSNNSARYFEYYFGRYPSIIRRNRTSVAVLKGNETEDELNLLADDVHLYFGLGCRNVTKVYVPQNYDFLPLLTTFKKYSYFVDHTKYKNNYDYNLALLIMNTAFYMTNESILLVENDEIFSPISQLNYSFYSDMDEVLETLKDNKNIQCISGATVKFGTTQQPTLYTYADGIDTMQFLLSL